MSWFTLSLHSCNNHRVKSEEHQLCVCVQVITSPKIAPNQRNKYNSASLSLHISAQHDGKCRPPTMSCRSPLNSDTRSAMSRYI